MIPDDPIDPLKPIELYDISDSGRADRIGMCDLLVCLSGPRHFIEVTQDLASFQYGLTCFFIPDRLVQEGTFIICQSDMIYFRSCHRATAFVFLQYITYLARCGYLFKCDQSSTLVIH